MKPLIFIVVVVLALIFGFSVALMGGVALLVMIPVSIVLLSLHNYRIAVVLLIFAIPLTGSILVPQARGLNIFTYATAAGVMGLLLKKLFVRQGIVWPPRVLLFCMIAPLIAGVLLGIPNVDEGSRNLLIIRPDLIFNVESYLKQNIYQPFLLIIFSVLLANAVSESKRPGRYVWLFALSALFTVLYVMIFTVSHGLTWGPHRWVISQAGMHYNEYGKLFSLAFGPLLYVAFSERGFSRVLFGAVATTVLVGIIFNFARSGILAVIVTLAVFLWQRKSLGVGITVFLVLAMLILLAPEEWRSRMLQGSDEFSSTHRGEAYSALTSGRFGAWIPLLPDIMLSPLFGRGVGSTIWNSGVSSGLYSSTHPHNMYLQIILDIGFVGFALMLYFYYRLLRVMHQLSNNLEIEPRLRAFFAGSRASLFGMLFLAVSGGDWYPRAEQGFLWIYLGILFAYWRRAEMGPTSIAISPIVKDPIRHTLKQV